MEYVAHGRLNGRLLEQYPEQEDIFIRSLIMDMIRKAPIDTLRKLFSVERKDSETPKELLTNEDVLDVYSRDSIVFTARLKTPTP